MHKFEEDFNKAQTILKRTGEAMYNLGLVGVGLVTRSPQAVQGVQALRAKIEGKPFTPPTPNPNAPGLVNLEPITTEDAFTRPDMTGTGEQPIIEDVPQYPVVLQRILKVKRDNPEVFSGIVGSIGKDNTQDDDDELNKRYQEINNPDSYITDPLNPDYGKLKSEIEPIRAAEAASDKKIYDAEKLKLDKKFIMEHPLGLDNLVPDETILDLKKESRQVAALMWDINYPFEDKKGFRYFDQEIRKAMEKQFPGQDLKLRSHHLNPLKSGAAMLNGLSMEDRAEATARLLDEFGLVGGNSPFQNTVLPREIHNEVHRFLSRFSTRYLSEIGDPQFDNSFYRLSLEGRMPMLKRYAQMIRQSEELIFTLMQAQNIASGAVDTVVTPEVASNILSKIPTNTTDTTFKFLQDAYDDIKTDILERLGEDTIGIGGGTDINIAPKGATLKTRRKFGKLQTNPEKFVASDDEYRSMALDRIFKFRRSRQLDIFETDESLRAEIAKIAKRLKQEDLDPSRGRFRK